MFTLLKGPKDLAVVAKVLTANKLKDGRFYRFLDTIVHVVLAAEFVS